MMYDFLEFFQLFNDNIYQSVSFHHKKKSGKIHVLDGNVVITLMELILCRNILFSMDFWRFLSKSLV